MSDNFLETVADQSDAKGFEEIDNGSISIPFLKLAQSLNDECNKNKDKYIEGLEPGMFFNSGEGKVYGKELDVICLGFERKYLEWKPRSQGGGLVGYHTPSEAEAMTVSTQFGKWATPAGNSLTETYIYKLLVVGDESKGVIIASLTSSNINEGKKWNRQLLSTIMANGKKAPPYFMVWTISSVYKENSSGSWYGWKINHAKTKDGKIKFVGEEQYNAAVKQRELLETTEHTYAEQSSLPASGDENEEVEY